MAIIHPTAVVDPGAELGNGVSVGPFCYVEAGAKIGDGCRLDSHATIKKWTTLGARNFVGQGAVLGGDPQDRKYKGEPTYLEIGDDNVIREYVTINRATGEANSTVIQNDCFIMAYVHFGHNCTVCDHVTIANNCQVAGHVTIEERANIGGSVGIHQFVRIGKASMIAAMSFIGRDAPPFMITDGFDNDVRDINAVGLRRLGITAGSRLALHKACKILFKSQLNRTNALETVRREVPQCDEVRYLLEFEERRFRGKNGRGDQP